MTPMQRRIRWVHVNLFAKPFDTVLTLIVIPSLLWIVWALLHWAVALADWGVVLDSLKVLLTGIFPPEKLWLVWVAAALLAGLMGLATSASLQLGRTAVVIAALLFAGLGLGTLLTPHVHYGTLIVLAVFYAVWLLGLRVAPLRARLTGVAFATLALVLLVLSPAGPASWGGLLLSVIITLTAALVTIPLGVLLAFGRQSKVASLRALSTGYIEVMRSVPLILVVYCIWIAFPLVAPSLPVPDVVRGLIGFTLFYSAYAAEFIRAGLQAVPRGQVEAAESIGLSSVDVKRIVVLPQALRVAVPGLVGNILDIFNYAPLVFIIGLLDFLRAGQMVLADPANSGRTYEIYVFMFVTYFAVGSLITFQARRLEDRLKRGERK